MSALTHEQYIQTVRDIIAHGANDSDREKIERAKLCYGFGRPGLRGVTIYSRWANGHGPDDCDPFVEICAAGEESTVQLAGTTIHELAHVVCGWRVGHGPEWKQTCARLGLRRVKAAGTNYHWSMFEQSLRTTIVALGDPCDGRPHNGRESMKIGVRRGRVGPCTAGVGTRGGASRGAGSGSRMRKYTADCGQIIRAGTDSLDATCNCCGSLFTLA